MRCLTLAAELQRRRARVIFLCRRLHGDLTELIAGAGFEVRRLPPAGDDVRQRDGHSWLDVPERRDADDTIEALGGLRPDWLIVDHYGIGAEWHRALRSRAARILVVDDLANRQHDCDVLLDQNYFGDAGATRYDGFVAQTSRRLLGPRYALLQPEYAAAREALRRREAAAARVLVFFGGSDPTNETAKALDALSSATLADLEVDVVVGSTHSDVESVRQRVAARAKTTLHRNLPTLAPLMMRADLAVGAGGATTWERLCLDLPSVVVTIVEHQAPHTAVLAREGYLRWVGNPASATVDAYIAAIEAERRRDRPSLAPLVDGFGARRVGEALCPSSLASLSIRPARTADAALFFDWRNDPAVRAQSFSTAPIGWTAHREWFSRKLVDPACELFVAEADGLPVGQFRHDYNGDEASLSYALDVVARGRGWGKWLVSAAIAQAARRAVSMCAHVKPENAASRRIFSTLGFQEAVGGDGNLTFRWSPSAAPVR